MIQKGKLELNMKCLVKKELSSAEKGGIYLECNGSK
jgi:hypothetical protein